MSPIDHCTGCVHFRPLWWYGGGTVAKPSKACHFILDTGHRRGDPIPTCTKKITHMKGTVKNEIHC